MHLNYVTKACEKPCLFSGKFLGDALVFPCEQSNLDGWWYEVRKLQALLDRAQTMQTWSCLETFLFLFMSAIFYEVNLSENNSRRALKTAKVVKRGQRTFISFSYAKTWL